MRWNHMSSCQKKKKISSGRWCLPALFLCLPHVQHIPHCCFSKGPCLCCKSLCIFMLLFLSHPLPVLIFCSLNSLCREFRVRANSKGNFEVCSAFWKQLWVFMLWQRIKQRNKPPVLQYVTVRLFRVRLSLMPVQRRLNSIFNSILTVFKVFNSI